MSKFRDTLMVYTVVRMGHVGKKNVDSCVKELINAVFNNFLRHLQENPKFWLINGSVAVVLLGILKSGTEEKLRDAITSVANYLVDPDNTILKKDKEMSVYEHAGLHIVLEKIIGYDQTLEKNNKKSNVQLAIQTLKSLLEQI
ncbi:uncharacterized protein LOC112682959 [Sipha flava]|uniref:Uncharacterized protein LOC112682959 n=1 Tax=Sipha flava TaxID=143950 RepID=A0A8B8FFK5_9HEMI|nr:uncharacterized protein LOC112682959 [Sipha flava]